MALGAQIQLQNTAKTVSAMGRRCTGRAVATGQQTGGSFTSRSGQFGGCFDVSNWRHQSFTSSFILSACVSEAVRMHVSTDASSLPHWSVPHRKFPASAVHPLVIHSSGSPCPEVVFLARHSALVPGSQVKSCASDGSAMHASLRFTWSTSGSWRCLQARRHCEGIYSRSERGLAGFPCRRMC